MLLAAVPLAGAAYGVWDGLDALLGRSFLAQAVAVLSGISRRNRRLRGRGVGRCGCPRRGRSGGCWLAAAAGAGKSRAMSPEEKMDVEAQIECLNTALRLQHRSVLMYSVTAGSVIGLEYQAHAEKMREHALSELEDATRLAEKITALGGQPTTEVGRVQLPGRPGARPRPARGLRGRDARGPAGRDRADRAARPPPRPWSTGSST